MLGLGSILGTGIFVSLGMGAGAAGPAVLLAIALAAGLATCNALSSAQLAAAYPVSGGTYEYGYRLLGPTFGFTAGWMFLCAKSASAATAALGVAGYGLQLVGIDAEGWLPFTALLVASAVTGLVLAGLRRSSRANIAIVSLTLLALAGFAVAGALHLSETGTGPFTPFFANERNGSTFSAVLYATALMFVAYTGYGRIATMGEEVSDPGRTIPRAIVITLIVSALLYLLVAVAAIAAVGTERLSLASERATPLEAAALALDVPGLGALVAVGAVTAMLGVLLNLVLGLSRVLLAMGRRRDVPPLFASVTSRGVPRPAVLAVGIAIAALALTGEVELTWAFSAFTVLVYYALTNWAALRLPRHLRLYPRFVSWLGLGGCLFLTPFLPLTVWLAGAALIAGGLLLQQAVRRKWMQP